MELTKMELELKLKIPPTTTTATTNSCAWFNYRISWFVKFSHTPKNTKDNPPLPPLTTCHPPCCGQRKAKARNRFSPGNHCDVYLRWDRDPMVDARGLGMCLGCTEKTSILGTKLVFLLNPTHSNLKFLNMWGTYFSNQVNAYVNFLKKGDDFLGYG